MPPTLPEYLGTVLSVKGMRRAGEADKAYATFLNSPVSDKQVLKQGPLKKKSNRSLYERWVDRYVVLRGNFITVARSNSRVGSVCKVHQVARVCQGMGNCDFKVTTLSHEVLIFKAVSTAERVSWMQVIEEIVAVEDQGPDFQQAARRSTSGTNSSSVAGPTDEQMELNSLDSSSSLSGLLPLIEPNDAVPASPMAASVLSAATVLAAPVESSDEPKEQAGARRRILSAPPLSAPSTHVAPTGPTTPLETVNSQSATASAEASSNRPANGVTVGIFWDMETVLRPSQLSNEEAKKSVSTFAGEYGEVDVFKTYPASRNLNPNFLRRSEREILLWLWDHTRRNSGTALLVLVSGADMTPILSAVHDRGVRVIIVTPENEAAMHPSPYMFGHEQWDCIQEVKKCTSIWGSQQAQPRSGPLSNIPKPPSTEDLQQFLNTFLRAGSTSTVGAGEEVEPDDWHSEELAAVDGGSSSGDHSSESMPSRTASNAGTIFAEQIAPSAASREAPQNIETFVLSKFDHWQPSAHQANKPDDQATELEVSHPLAAQYGSQSVEHHQSFCEQQLPSSSQSDSSAAQEASAGAADRSAGVQLAGLRVNLNQVLIVANIILMLGILFGKEAVLQAAASLTQALLSAVQPFSPSSAPPLSRSAAQPQGPAAEL